MTTEAIRKNEIEVAVISSDMEPIVDVPSALDLMMTAMHETGCTNLAVNKGAITKRFFDLSACLAGEILQSISFPAALRGGA